MKVKTNEENKSQRTIRPRPTTQQEYKDRYNIEVRNKYELLNTKETPLQPEPEFIENKCKVPKLA